VLSTGTPTAGRRPGRHGFNFNVVEIDGQTSAKVTRYRSSEGTFARLPHFWAESLEATGRALLSENTAARNCVCDTLALTVDISPDGDVRRTNFYRGFRYLGEDGISEIPGQFEVYVNSGRVCDVHVDTEPNAAGIAAHLIPEEGDLRRQRFRVGVSQTIRCGHTPIDFCWQYYGPNCFAMSEQQFRRMQRGQVGPPVEWTVLNLSLVPVREATVLIKLPAGFEIDGEPALSIIDSNDRQVHRLEEGYRDNLVFNPYTNVIFLRLPYAPLGLRYRVSWRLRDEPPPSGGRVHSLDGKAKEIASWLLKLAKTNPKNNLLGGLLASIEQIAREHFGLAAADQDPLLLSIMVFDDDTCQLRVAAANFPDHDPGWGLHIDYGDGIAGRAYKMNLPRLFSRSRARMKGEELLYAAWPGSQPEEAVLSTPLAHPRQPGALFAILNIGSQRPGSGLVDLNEDAVTTKFQRAVGEACMTAIPQLYAAYDGLSVDRGAGP
jgi:hypothetical protein